MLWVLGCFVMLLVVLSMDNNKELKRRGKSSEEIAGVGFFLYSDGEDCNYEGSDEGGEGIDGM